MPGTPPALLPSVGPRTEVLQEHAKHTKQGGAGWLATAESLQPRIAAADHAEATASDLQGRARALPAQVHPAYTYSGMSQCMRIQSTRSRAWQSGWGWRRTAWRA